MAKLKDFDVVREKWLSDYGVKKEYDALSTEMGTKPTAISRFESPNYGKLSISTLKKIAQVLNCDLQIRLRPRKISSVKG
jgi:transcriptional regulator with XRE-family HTH domain